MSETNNSDDIVNNNISFSIEVCRGPDCTGLGGGAALLEIEELVREHRHTQTGQETIRVVVGGCRDFCSVGPNVHIHARKRNQTGSKRKTNVLLESFQGVNDASSCSRVLESILAYNSPSNDPTTFPPRDSSSMIDRHRSMMARKAERQRWEALKDVSRTIAKCQKTVSSNLENNALERKQRVWKESCRDCLEQCTPSMGQSQAQQERERRRVQHLVEIASETLDRICLQNDSDSDSSSYTSSSSEE